MNEQFLLRLKKKLANESLICIAKVKRLTEWNPIPGPSCSRQTREKTLKSRVKKKKKDSCWLRFLNLFCSSSSSFNHA